MRVRSVSSSRISTTSWWRRRGDYSVLALTSLLTFRMDPWRVARMDNQDSDVDVGKINRLERFKRIEVIRRHFWDRFSLEYVALLQQKVKWHSSRAELKLGSLVLIKDRALPPSLWSLGRVTKVYPGSDGISRVAEVLTKRGTIRRAFNNICPLPEL
ncbi:uncharacterized protein LOC126057021 [Helicoverpa armigera]|uniref:uncharacterized protein LOC126057021 n=1 Tax=Helicoverpa armigera TaxID=29058 RepID=UPI0030827D70